MRAIHRTAARHFGFFKEPAALFAWLAASAVHRKSILKSPRIAIGVPVVADGAAALGYGQKQHVLQAFQQTFRLVRRDICRLAARINACGEQTFVCIDIAHPRQHFLIQQHALNG